MHPVDLTHMCSLYYYNIKLGLFLSAAFLSSQAGIPLPGGGVGGTGGVGGVTPVKISYIFAAVFFLTS